MTTLVDIAMGMCLIIYGLDRPRPQVTANADLMQAAPTDALSWTTNDTFPPPPSPSVKPRKSFVTLIKIRNDGPVGLAVRVLLLGAFFMVNSYVAQASLSTLNMIPDPYVLGY